MVFIGPTASIMKKFALKQRARDMAREVDIPVVPGTCVLEIVFVLIKTSSLCVFKPLSIPH